MVGAQSLCPIDRLRIDHYQTIEVTTPREVSRMGTMIRTCCRLSSPRMGRE
jgi:hypothetical protein